ncbi:MULTISPECIES: hypothetical protein [Sphingopyxis]|nr:MULTISPECIES: hypothetical protein [Sphingopyxis]
MLVEAAATWRGEAREQHLTHWRRLGKRAFAYGASANAISTS